MAERKAFPSPPNMSLLVEKDGTPTLAWAGWFGVVASWMQRTRVLTFNVDMPSISPGAAASAQVTIAGVKLGDFAAASLDPMNANLAISAAVSANDQVTVWVVNYGATAIDLAPGTLRVRVEKAR
jgi:hypothetical protein